jgi:DNA helicase II / ATP-dependent DNA helicase PcrA
MTHPNHPLLRTLNAQQRGAVTTTNGAVLVLAGPGSGKTRVLTHRIAWQLTEVGVPAWHILAVTFTNRAAREMRHRLDQMVGDLSTRSMALGTFHATCARILRCEAEHVNLNSDYLIFDTEDQLALMKQVVKAMNLDDKRYRPRSLLNAISGAKNEMLEPVDYPIQTYYDEVVARVYDQYQEALRANGGLDFDDLLMETVRLFRENPAVLERYRERYHTILVDEFQDTNMAQYVILRLLAAEHRNLYAVADEDQSIYSWRGADYRNIRRLRTDFPEIQEFLLEENYRSTQVILDAAQSVIAQNQDRTPKHLFTQRKGGRSISLYEAYDEQEEADYLAREIESLIQSRYGLGDIAIMYRTNAQSRAIEEALIKHNIPYRLIGGTRFYTRREIKDILAFLRLTHNPDDDVSFLRVVNVPPRGIGTRTLAKVTEAARRLETSRYQGLLSLIHSEKLRTRARNALATFATMVDRWVALRDEVTVADLTDQILADTEYEDYIRDRSEEGESRWENIQALRAVIAEAPDVSLTDFLTDVALVSDVDELSHEVDAVTLLTLHSAKGLEYPVVFLAGLEEGLLPHNRSMESPQEVAEERRLLYVGMTRAMDKLYLSYAFRRGWGGGYRGDEPTAPSRFLSDIPDEALGRSEGRGRKQKRTNWAVSGWSASSQTQKPAPPPEPQYRSGQRVKHAYYGEGMVLESAFEGRSEMVTVLFQNGIGVKKLLSDMAPMEQISEH